MGHTTQRNSKVIRVSNEVLNRLSEAKTKGESWDQVLERLTNTLTMGWVIEDDFHLSKAKAKGESVKRQYLDRLATPPDVYKIVRIG